MSNRWFTGVLIFALGFCSAVMMKVPSTQAAAREGVVEDHLRYIIGERGDFQLIYPKPNRADSYLAVGQTRSSSGQNMVKPVSFRRGKITFTKEQRRNLTIFRLTPVMKVTAQFANPCGPPVLCPFPPDPEPPPGPRPFGEQAIPLDQYTFDALGPDLARKPGL